jgi:hypothetical protein
VTPEMTAVSKPNNSPASEATTTVKVLIRLILLPSPDDKYGFLFF